MSVVVLDESRVEVRDLVARGSCGDVYQGILKSSGPGGDNVVVAVKIFDGIVPTVMT